MARSPVVLYADVEAAILRVLKAGDNVTFPKVYAELGSRGGGDSVNRHIAAWRDKCVGLFEQPVSPFDGIGDPRLVAVLREGVLAAQRVAQEIAAEGIAEREVSLDRERRRLHQAMLDASAAVVAAEATIRDLEHELAVTKAELAELRQDRDGF